MKSERDTLTWTKRTEIDFLCGLRVFKTNAGFRNRLVRPERPEAVRRALRLDGDEHVPAEEERQAPVEAARVGPGEQWEHGEREVVELRVGIRHAERDVNRGAVDAARGGRERLRRGGTVEAVGVRA